MRLIKPDLNIDFVGKTNFFVIISSIACFVSLLLIFLKGLNYGIDFSGGMEIQVKFNEKTPIAEVRKAIESVDLKGSTVQSIGKEGKEFMIRFQKTFAGADAIVDELKETLSRELGEGRIKAMKYEPDRGSFLDLYHDGSITKTQVSEVVSKFPDIEVMEGLEDEREGIRIKIPDVSLIIGRAFKEKFGEGAVEFRRVESVGPRVGEELRRNGTIAIIASLIMILIYVAFRFEITFAPGAVVCLAHDVVITMGVFALLGKEFNLTTIAALLTIVGYSLNDTIVVYDRIRENMRRSRKWDLPLLLNTSINQTLSRTILTSGTTLLAVIGILIFGTGVIVDFAFAMVIGIIVGTYSSIYIASPFMIFLQKRRAM